METLILAYLIMGVLITPPLWIANKRYGRLKLYELIILGILLPAIWLPFVAYSIYICPYSERPS